MILIRRLEDAEGLPHGSLVTLEDSLQRYDFSIAKPIIQNAFLRDGQDVQNDAMGGVVTNLHHPQDWDVFDQFARQVPLEQGEKVNFAIGCHPKQAALLSASRLKRLEKLIQRPGVVAVGECGLDYSARYII